MFEEHQLGEVFELLARVAEAIASLAGPQCDVFVYDYRTTHLGVVANYGSSRPLDESSTPPAPAVPPAISGRLQRDIRSARIDLPHGGEAGEASVWVRDITGHVVGALVMRVNYSDVLAAQRLLQRMLPNGFGEEREDVPPASNGEDMVARSVRDALLEHRTPQHALERDDRIAIIRALDHAGIFAVRHAADIVARELSISRASVYTYLRAARGETTTAS